MKTRITKRESKSSDYEMIDLQMVDGRGKRVFGANATIARSRKFMSKAKWSQWIPTWGSCSSRTMEEKEREFAVINEAMKIARELNK